MGLNSEAGGVKCKTELTKFSDFIQYLMLLYIIYTAYNLNMAQPYI